MPKPDVQARFSLASPRFLALDAYVQPTEAEPHTSWYASFGENLDEDNARVVIATLHATGDDFAVNITIAGSFFWGSSAGEPKTRAGLAKAISESYALETLYDMARTQAGALAGVVLANIDLPVKSPDALVREFSEDRGGADEPQAAAQG